ncbi:MAG: phosphoglucomutase/phosphomannomutase family protein [Rhodothermaceae bacterium]|nr:phosphoglucomutase/phosphomannomutase family protein [Rhodothermaceae bacterium]
MAKPTIKFGTDGWRAVIGAQYTFDNLEIVSRATAQWLRKTYGNDLKIVIGHDTRFQGRAFSEHAAAVMASQGIKVIFAETFTTTPSISWGAKAFGCNAGIVITASHNPPSYNGFKIKAHFGGPASPAMIKAVEDEMTDLEEYTFKSFSTLVDEGVIVMRDVATEYLDLLREKLDIQAIKSSGIKVAHDAMYGAGQGAIQALLGEDKVIALHHDLNPGFHGQAPEPIEKNLKELSEAVVREGCAAGLANDGDADRIGMYDENGTFVDSHQLLCLLVKYLHEVQGLSGDIVKTFSTTSMLAKMGETYGLKVHTTPIGFKHIGPIIVDGDVIVGGEESGGMAVKGHIPERDGIYIGLLVVEMMVKRGKKLSELVQELYDQFGPHSTYRIDVHTTPEKKENVLKTLSEGGLKSIFGRDVVEVDTLDGFKHMTTNGWLLVRPSGTEPVLRVYSEADTPEGARGLVTDAATQLGVIEPENATA